MLSLNNGFVIAGTVSTDAVGSYIECVCKVDGKKLVSTSQYIKLYN